MKQEDGFTLLEMLISLALLALLSGFMVTGLRFSSQVRTAEVRANLLSETDGARRHLRQTFAGAQTFKSDFVDSREILSFAGTSSQVSITAPLDDRVATGGLYTLGYGMDSQRHFTLRFKLFRFGNSQIPERSTVLLENIAGLGIRYFSEGRWQDKWDDPQRAPQAIEVSVVFPEGDDRSWSPLVINLPLAN